MAKDIPFDEDVMSIIMGVSPNEPGQHGRTSVSVPTKDAVAFVTEIRDMCDDFLKSVGKSDDDASEKAPEDAEGEKEDE